MLATSVLLLSLPRRALEEKLLVTGRVIVCCAPSYEAMVDIDKRGGDVRGVWAIGSQEETQKMKLESKERDRLLNSWVGNLYS